jgi:hypothetical protein
MPAIEPITGSRPIARLQLERVRLDWARSEQLRLEQQRFDQQQRSQQLEAQRVELERIDQQRLDEEQRVAQAEPSSELIVPRRSNSTRSGEPSSSTSSSEPTGGRGAPAPTSRGAAAAVGGTSLPSSDRVRGTASDRDGRSTGRTGIRGAAERPRSAGRSRADARSGIAAAGRVGELNTPVRVPDRSVRERARVRMTLRFWSAAASARVDEGADVLAA